MPRFVIAALHAQAGRHFQVTDLAWLLVPIFSPQGLPGHALTALAQLRQAAEKEVVTAELAARPASYFGRASFLSELRFEE